MCSQWYSSLHVIILWSAEVKIKNIHNPITSSEKGGIQSEHINFESKIMQFLIITISNQLCSPGNTLCVAAMPLVALLI